MKELECGPAADPLGTIGEAVNKATQKLAKRLDMNETAFAALAQRKELSIFIRRSGRGLVLLPSYNCHYNKRTASRICPCCCTGATCRGNCYLVRRCPRPRPRPYDVLLVLQQHVLCPPGMAWLYVAIPGGQRTCCWITSSSVLGSRPVVLGSRPHLSSRYGLAKSTSSVLHRYGLAVCETPAARPLSSRYGLALSRPLSSWLARPLSSRYGWHVLCPPWFGLFLDHVLICPPGMDWR